MKLQTQRLVLISLGLILFIAGCYYLILKPIAVENSAFSNQGTSSTIVGYNYRGYFFFVVGLLLAIRGTLLGKAPKWLA